MKSRVYGATGGIATNAVAQTYWFWDGQRSRCANVGGYMYDFVLLDGPGDLDVKWEPRNCSPNRGEYCQGSCPLQWLASTQAPNSAFKFWAVTVGFHRFHYFIPAGTPIPGGVQHDFYHFDRAEYLVEPTRAFFTGISCYAGGNYGRGFPWYQYHGCVADAG
ncbi:MAG: hypothetical protein AB1689_22160 [Thermodesulfobacteriota bacterium]